MIEYTNQTRRDYTFFMPAALRVSDVDINNHANQSVYYEFFDTIILRYLEKCRQGKAFHQPSDNLTSFCVENGCLYRREISFSEPMKIALKVAHIGTSSLRFDLAVFTEGHDDPNALAYFALVFVNKVTRRPTPIPYDLKRQLQEG